jgi:hypothetical protein
MGRHTLFGSLYVMALGSSGATSPIYVAGVTQMTPSESSNTRMQSMAGNDWREIVMGERDFGFSLTRWMPRGYDLRAITHRAYGYVGDVDWRQLPIVLMYQYNQIDPSGQVVIENASWMFMQYIVTRYDGPIIGGTHDLLTENATMIGRGLSFVDSDGTTYGNAPALWGSAPST